MRRREAILRAEGTEAVSQILVAEGEKEAADSAGRCGKAGRDPQGRRAKPRLFWQVQQAMADSLQLLNEASPNEQVIKHQGAGSI